MTLPPPRVGEQADTQRGLSAATLWDRLRQARANVQELQNSIENLRKSGPRFKEVLAQERGLWTENETQAESDITLVQAVVDAGEAKPHEIADELTLLDNDWDRAKAYWKAFADAPPGESAEREERLSAIQILLSRVVWRSAILTVPSRVQEYLTRQRIGGAFDFHEAFKDELPIESDRIEMLRYLKASPGGIYGIVDVDAGIIWATSPDPRRQRRTYFGIAVIALLGLGATVAACQLNLGGPFVSTRRDELVFAYVLVAVGVLVHIAIDLYKQSKTTGRMGNWTAVDDLVLWGHAHELQMYITAFSVWAGLIALAYTFGKVEPATAFIAGYSLDSFLDVVLLRFSNTIDAGTAAVKKQVGAV